MEQRLFVGVSERWDDLSNRAFVFVWSFRNRFLELTVDPYSFTCGLIGVALFLWCILFRAMVAWWPSTYCETKLWRIISKILSMGIKQRVLLKIRTDDSCLLLCLPGPGTLSEWSFASAGIQWYTLGGHCKTSFRPWDTVDGRNAAPVGRWFIPFFSLQDCIQHSYNIPG